MAILNTELGDVAPKKTAFEKVEIPFYYKKVVSTFPTTHQS